MLSYSVFLTFLPHEESKAAHCVATQGLKLEALICKSERIFNIEGSCIVRKIISSNTNSNIFSHIDAFYVCFFTYSKLMYEMQIHQQQC